MQPVALPYSVGTQWVRLGSRPSGLQSLVDAHLTVECHSDRTVECFSVGHRRRVLVLRYRIRQQRRATHWTHGITVCAGISNYVLGFGHIMLSPGDVPLLNRWRFITSFFTYMPCMMISLFVVGM